jgi:hypothetical protein
MRYIKLSATNLATQNHVQKQGQALSSTNLAQSAFLSPSYSLQVIVNKC